MYNDMYWIYYNQLVFPYKFPIPFSPFHFLVHMYMKNSRIMIILTGNHTNLWKKSRRRSDQDLLACRTRMWHCCCLVSRSFQKAWRRFTNWQRFQVFAHKYSELQPVHEIFFFRSAPTQHWMAALTMYMMYEL